MFIESQLGMALSLAHELVCFEESGFQDLLLSGSEVTIPPQGIHHLLCFKSILNPQLLKTFSIG